MMASSSGDHGSNVPTLSQGVKRQPTMGLLDAINLLLACIIGSGIFISARAVLEYSGSYGLSIIVWIGCGLLCIMGALCYAELGCAYVSSGGDYTYLRVAFGNFPGFLRVWIEVVLSRPMIVVLSVLTASNYLVYWFYPTCTPPDTLVKCLSSFLLLIVGFINLISAVWTNRLHQICNYFKIASLLIVIGAGIYRIIRGRIENFAEPFEASTYGKLPSALYAGLFPYAGWNYLNNAIDDLKDPKRILPRSIVISLLICIFIYFLTFSSYFTALSPYDILMSEATAVSFAERVFPPLLYIIPIGVTMSCVGAASGNIFTVVQMFDVAGRDGLMPHIFSMRHYKSNVPMIAIMFEIIISFIFLFFMSNIGKLIICVGMINWICILLAAVGLIVLRYKHPDRERPIKIPLPIPIIFITILVILILASAVTDIDNVKTSLILLGTAVPAYIFGVMWKKKPMLMATTGGCEAMWSGNTVLFYVNRDGLPLSDRCNEQMWNFCIEQYPKNATEIIRIRDQIRDYPSVTYIEPPYHVATNSRFKIQEKLQLIQNYIQRLEYNYTGMQFFDLNPARSLYGLMDTARHMMTESLPIKCFEAFLIALYLTTGILGLDRFNISFKTRFKSIIYRHVILGIKYGQSYGALGLSRRCDLSYKPLNEKYDRLSTLIGDFVSAYQNYGHTVLRIKIGLPIIHDLKSFLTINWKALVIQPNKTDRSEYDRELDKIVRIWRQIDVHMTHRSIVPLASLVQPTGTLITTASLPNRLQSISFRQNRETSLNCRRSAIKKTSMITRDDNSVEKDESVPYAIRV